MAQQPWPVTRAERSNYRETSHYADVVDFLRKLQLAGAPISVEMIGTSTEGKPIPMAIASYPQVTSVSEAQRSGKPIVYIQANIHAGEVEGKEAALHVLRRLSQEGPKGLLGKVILLVVPIYNIDGNEKWGPVARNRPEQDGPDVVGVRANGQGLDLNRDSIKAESPEFQAILERIYTTWDPEVMMDLHTTDGTRHGWDMTYATPNVPITEPGILTYSRDVMIPALRKDMVQKYKSPMFDYGNAENRGGKTDWYTFGHESRYSTNYVGLRNRIGILSEATTYIPFKRRVEVTDQFVTSILEYVAKNAKKIKQIVRDADANVVSWGLNPAKAPLQGVRFEFASRGKEDVILEKLKPRESVVDITKAPRTFEVKKMDVFDRFTNTRTTTFPAAYVLSTPMPKTVDLLLKHGVVVERLVETTTVPVQSFTTIKANVASGPFQGHRLVQLDGTYTESAKELPAGTLIVRTSQPLGILAFNLLDPESDDGVIAWGHLGEKFEVGGGLPIWRMAKPAKLILERLTGPKTIP